MPAPTWPTSSTKAVLDGDEWVINGQKIWTTQGFIADYIFVLCRTDPDAPKHKGISYLLCPMDQPGIEVRKITQIDGAAEFAEVFFTDARCPKENVVGEVNNGWAIAMTTLGFERGTSATTGYRRFEKELEVIIDAAKANGKIDDPMVRQELALAWSKVQIMRINGLRSLTSVVQNKKDLGVAALGATNKMFWSEYHQRVMNLAIDVLGPRRADPHRGPVDRGGGARLRRPPHQRRLPLLGAAVVVLLLTLRDHLGRHRRRSSATSWASGCSACPRNRRSRRPSRSLRDRRAGPDRPRGSRRHQG